MSHTRIDAVLPCNPLTRDKNDIYRVRVCVESFRATGSTDTVSTIFVLTPPKWKAALTDLLADLPYARVLDEFEILSAQEQQAFLEVPGWYRQQILKLCANRLIQEPACITLDSDVVNMRKLTAGDIYSGSRVFFQPDRQKSDWIAGSCQVLGIETVTTPRMGVTPAYLAAEGLKLVQDHLEEQFGPWIPALAKAIADGGSWTEYMLYQGGLQKLGMWDELHCPLPKGDFIFRGFWQKTEPTEEVVDSTLAQSPSFLVVQSLNREWQTLHALLSRKGIFSYEDLPQGFIDKARSTFNRVRAE